MRSFKVIFLALACLFTLQADGQQVVSPFAPGQVLAAQQGGTQMDPSTTTAGQVLITTGNPQSPWTFGAAGSGTVSTLSVAAANGFAGTVATPTTTPVITIRTSVTGLLKGNGTAASAAVSGTDYAPPTSGSALLAGNGSGGFATPTAATIGAPVSVVTTVAVTPGSTTPASSGLSVSVTAGATYTFEVNYFVTSTATFNTIGFAGGTATMTSISGNINADAGPANGVQITSLSTTYTAISAAVICYKVVGSFVVNAAGTFVPTFASTAAAADSLLVGSWMRLARVN